MKKQYIKPVTEDVKLSLFGSVLGGMDVIGGSPGTPIADAKEQDGFFETDDSFGDIWDDGDNSSNPYDLWGE